MTDRETGKLKGFGFCEYMDLATAESAKRNLNGRDYNGRQLRVDSQCAARNSWRAIPGSQFSAHFSD